jgi:hypothetical protein
MWVTIRSMSPVGQARAGQGRTAFGSIEPALRSYRAFTSGVPRAVQRLGAGFARAVDDTLAASYDRAAAGGPSG